MRLIAKWILVALAFLALPSVIDGISIASFTTALIIAFFWGLASLTVRPILNIILLPINILTLGLFSFIINAFLFWGIGSFITGVHVSGFVPALLGSLVISVAGFIADKLLSKD